MADQTQERTMMQKYGLPLVAGGVTGFFAAMGITKLIKSGRLGELDTSVEMAMLMALIYFITGLSVLIGALSPSFGARFLNVEDADELREQRQMLTYSAIGMFALAAALTLAAMAQPAGAVPAGAAVAGIVVTLAIACLTTWRQTQVMDELMQTVSREASSWAFYMLFLIGGGWSLLAHVGYINAPQPLDWLSMFAGILLLASFVVTGKRGMLMRR